jgi:hypothetical protein
MSVHRECSSSDGRPARTLGNQPAYRWKDSQKHGEPNMQRLGRASRPSDSREARNSRVGDSPPSRREDPFKGRQRFGETWQSTTGRTDGRRCRPCERGKQRGRKKRGRTRNKRFEVGPTNHDWFESHPTHEPHVIMHAVRATGRGRWRHVRWLKAPTTLRQHHGGAPRPTVVVAQHIIVAAPGPCVRERERENTRYLASGESKQGARKST